MFVIAEVLTNIYRKTKWIQIFPLSWSLLCKLLKMVFFKFNTVPQHRIFRMSVNFIYYLYLQRVQKMCVEELFIRDWTWNITSLMIRFFYFAWIFTILIILFQVSFSPLKYMIQFLTKDTSALQNLAEKSMSKDLYA